MSFVCVKLYIFAVCFDMVFFGGRGDICCWFSLKINKLQRTITNIHAIILSMLMLSLIFVIICGLFQYKPICTYFACAFKSVLPLEIKLS